MQFENLFTELQYYISIKDAKAQSEDSDITGTLISISNQFLEKNPAKALEAVKAMPKDYQKTNALLKILDKLLEQGDITKALEVAKAIRSKDRKIEQLIKISKLEDKAKAIEILNEALEIASSIPNDYVKNDFLKLISNNFRERGSCFLKTFQNYSSRFLAIAEPRGLRLALEKE